MTKSGFIAAAVATPYENLYSYIQSSNIANMYFNSKFAVSASGFTQWDSVRLGGEVTKYCLASRCGEVCWTVKGDV